MARAWNTDSLLAFLSSLAKGTPHLLDRPVIPVQDPPRPALQSVPAQPLLGRLDLSPPGSSGEAFQSEISTTVRLGSRLFVVSAGGGTGLQVSEATNPAAPVFLRSESLGAFTTQSVASRGNLVAVALSPSDYDTTPARGLVRFYRLNGDGSLTLLQDVQVGYLPDSLTFSEDGRTLVVANEAQPGWGTKVTPASGKPAFPDAYKVDPAGSISLITIGGFNGFRTTPFSRLTFQATELGFEGLALPAGVRISGPGGTSSARDIEPEYVSVLGRFAYVTLQENNAVAKVDLRTKAIVSVFDLGAVDFSRSLVDLSDKDGGFKPKLGQAFSGLRMPDGIAAFRSGGKDWFLTANEGDSRVYADESNPVYSDERRNATAPDGRLKTIVNGVNGPSAVNSNVAFGGRSLSLFDASTGALVWDSGNSLQSIAVAAGTYDDNRSDDKGVEPETVVTASLGGRTYAIVALERGLKTTLAVFDVTDPAASRYVNHAVIATSVSPEGLKVVPASETPGGRALLVVSNEVSNTLDVLDLQALVEGTASGKAGSFTRTMLVDAGGGPDLSIQSLLTVGEITAGTAPGSPVYVPPGIFDGTGAFDNGDGTWTLLVNHELSASAGYAYAVDVRSSAFAAPQSVNITGSRISRFVIDKDVDDNAANGFQSRVISGGLAYRDVVGSDSNGFDRFCSASLFEAGRFGAGRGFQDRVYLTGEESNGAFYALDPASGVLYEAKALGKGSWENAAQVDTGNTNTVALVLFDDTKAPLYLYVGSKNPSSTDFLDRNGLSNGKLYVWVPNSGVIPEAGPDNTAGPDSDDLRAIALNTSLAGSWKQLGEGDPGFVLADKTAAQLRTAALGLGALTLTRPEDGDTNPLNGRQVLFATTGSGDFGGADAYGNLIQLDFSDSFGSDGLLKSGGSTALKVIYDGDRLADPTAALRSPDNLVWSADGSLYVQEDRTVSPWGTVDGSIWKLNPSTIDPLTGASAERWAVIDRPVAGPDGLTALYGQTDSFPLSDPKNLGEWESSGIIDVSSIYGAAPGTWFLADVQAHGLKDGTINGNGYLVEGGQLDLIRQPAVI